LTEDPIGFGGGINLYVYAGNDPINHLDPFGLDWQDDLLYDTAHFSAGAGSALTFGITDYFNRDVINPCSGWYTGGKVAGVALSTAIGAKGLPTGLRGLSMGTKGAIGEGLSYAENTLQGSTNLAMRTRSIPGFRTIVDSTWESASGEIYYVESKFGTGRLTAAQRTAAKALGDAYHVERWDYPFFGRVGGYLGFGSGAAGAMAGRKSVCD
jgi:hypothetical protein